MNRAPVSLNVPTDPSAAIAGRSRRADGWARQAPRRRAEQATRRQAARLCEELAHGGGRCRQVAERLCVPGRTLRRWRRLEDACRPRGRPCKESPPAARLAVLGWLDGQGCHWGLPALRAAFPGMPRCELQELQRQWHAAYRVTHPRCVARLTWQQPGRVWAIDHTQPPQPVDGRAPWLLTVRDLASGMQLAWQAVADETAATTVAVVASLFREHGAPLVLKSDNGSAFTSDQFARLLASYGVAWLPSPPRRPAYNGSCEATNRHAKLRTEHFARRDHDGCWTTAALEAARRQANELARPHGHLGPSPAEVWQARAPITTPERDAFTAACAQHRQEILDVTNDFRPDNLNHVRRLNRRALRRALLDLGLVTITPRAITLPFKLQKAAKIS